MIFINVWMVVECRLQSMLKGHGELAVKREAARKLREEGKERERRLLLAQHRDKIRRRMVADGIPVPEALKEQEWERQIARGEVRHGRLVIVTIFSVHECQVCSLCTQDKFSVAERERKAAEETLAQKKTVNFIINADTQGSIDAIQDIISKLPKDVQLPVLRALHYTLKVFLRWFGLMLCFFFHRSTGV